MLQYHQAPTAANLMCGHAEDLKDPYESRRMARASRTLYAGTAASQAREVRDVRGREERSRFWLQRLVNFNTNHHAYFRGMLINARSGMH